MTFVTLLRGTAAAGTLAATLAAAPSAEAAMTRTITLNDPSTFANETGDNDEVPALAAPGTPGSVGSGGWSADPSLTGDDDKQHLIYVNGDLPGPYDDSSGPIYREANGDNSNLLYDSTESVTIGDIQSISFDTNAGGGTDWFVDVFTRTGTASDDAGWYGTNLDFTTSRLRTETAPNGFTRYIFDDQGGPDDEPTVDRDPGDTGDGDHPNGPFDLQGMKNEFGSEEILFIALGTGTNYANFDGAIDNFQFEYINLNDESVTTQIDLEPVPVPAALPLFATGLAGVAAYTRWRKRR